MARDQSEEAGRPRPDQLAIDIAVLTYEEKLDRRAVGRALGVDPKTVAAYLRRARGGLVALRVEDPTAPVIDRAIGARLEALRGIRTVIAVKVNPPVAEVDSAEAHAAHSVELHRQLANAAAWFLWDHLRNGDRIAVGPGRGVRFTVDALSERKDARPRSFSGQSVVSTMGNPIVPSDRPLNVFEADAIAAALGSVLGVEGTRIKRVGLPYVANRPAAQLRALGNRLMDRAWDKDGIPDIAIIGLGVLHPRHHLLASWRTDEQLRPVHRILEQIEETVLPACKTAIADVGDRFWLRQGALDGERAETARRLVEALNSKIVAVPPAKLDQTWEKVLVAGGAAKYPAMLSYVRQLHTNEVGVQATVLVTDATTARQVVDDLNAPADDGATGPALT